MNKKGFTLIEILAVIIIIGIASTIAITSISSSISRSRDSAFVDLAKTYAESARAMRVKDDFYYDPKPGEGIIMPYSMVDSTDIENGDQTGYGKIIPSYCYVSVLNNNTNYYYYSNQVDDTYHFIVNGEYNKMSEDDIKVDFAELANLGVKELKAPYDTFSIKYDDVKYNIKALRVKYTAEGGGKKVALYGYYTKDNNYTISNAHLKGNITVYDTYKSTGTYPGSENGKVRYNNVDYTIKSDELMYIVIVKE